MWEERSSTEREGDREEGLKKRIKVKDNLNGKWMKEPTPEEEKHLLESFGSPVIWEILNKLCHQPYYVLVSFSQLCFAACLSEQRRRWNWFRIRFQCGFSRVWKSGVRKWRSSWALSPVEALRDQRAQPGQGEAVPGVRGLSVRLEKKVPRVFRFQKWTNSRRFKTRVGFGEGEEVGRRSNGGKGHWRRSKKGIRRLSLWHCMGCPYGHWDHRDVDMSWGKAEPGMWSTVLREVKRQGCPDHWSVTNTSQHDRAARKHEPERKRGPQSANDSTSDH